MATNAAMERNIKNIASSAFISLSEGEPEPEVEPEPESGASDIRRKSELIEELTKTLGENSNSYVSTFRIVGSSKFGY